MRRYKVITTVLLSAVLSWVLLLLNMDALGLDAKAQEVVEILPLWALITLGCHALFSIGSSLATFNDVPHEVDALHEDILRVKAALQSKGVPLE
mmetsp:Transcript_13715/g.46314  ORF Transcript_13715/g.46314 Transcript_13715/m.46314 type:complete len:94 (-) Transcript_13715:9-290(-)